MYIQKTTDARVLMIAQVGTTRGLPMYEICDPFTYVSYLCMGIASKCSYSQSNVNGKRPMPLFMPKSWFTTGLRGAVQHTQVK